MMNQNETILLDLIKSVDNTFQAGDDYQQCLKRKGLSVSHMLLFLANDAGIKVNSMVKLTQKIGKKVIEDTKFCQWMDSSFKMAWLKIKAIDLLGLNQDQFNMIMPYEIEGQFNGDIKEYFLQLGRGTGIQQLNSQNDVAEAAQSIQKSMQWTQVKSQLNNQLSKQEEISPEETQMSIQIANQQQKQLKQQKLMQLKQDLQKCQKSILDELFQQNLIKSLSGGYTSVDYNQFKDQLEKVASDFKIRSYQLTKQLKQPLVKDQDYYSKIINIRNKIHPIYVPDLVYLLQKNREAKNVVQGKDIVVILGISGAGKSTLVQMMLEYQLVVKNSDKELTTLVPKGGLRPQHKQFVAKASSKSVTKYVSVIELSPERYQNQGTLYLADTPGFFDTGGLIVDASNSLSTIRAISSANSVRFILLVNQKNEGTRGEGIKKLAKIVSKLFKKYKEDQILFFLNCFNQDQLKQLPILMKQIKDNLNASEKGDTKFYAVINHFWSLTDEALKISKKKKISMSQAIKLVPQLVVMNPKKPNIKEISEKVMDQQRRIVNPDKVLDNLISPQVKQALQIEVNNLNTIIQSSIEQKKIKAALYYINNLSEIAKETQQIGDIGQAQKKLDDLKTKLEQNFNTSFQKLEKTMQGQVLSLRISDAAMLQTKQQLNKLQQLEKVYKQIPLFENFDRSEDIANLVRNTTQSIQNKMGEQISEDLIKTIQVYSEQFDPSLKQNLIYKMQENSSKLMEQIVDVIKAEDYGNLQDKIKKFNEFTKLASKHKNFPQISQTWKTQLSKVTDERIQKCRKIFDRCLGQSNLLTELDVQELKETLDIFSRAGDYYQEPQIKKIVDARKQIKRQCLALCRKYISKIKKILRQSADNIRPQILQQVTMCKTNVIKIMNEIDEIKQEIQNQFTYELGSIVGVVNANIQSIDNDMANIQKDNEDWTAIRNIYNSIQILKKLSHICDQTERDKCLTIITQSEQELMRKLQNFHSDIESINISIDTPYQTLCRFMKAYRISVLDKKNKGSTIGFKFQNENIMRNVEDQGQQYGQQYRLEHEEERNQDQDHGQDKIMEICSKIKAIIIQKMQKILQDVKGFINQKMANNEAQMQNFDKAITTIAKIKRFFDAIKFTNFQPQQISSNINETNQKFETSFKEIFERLNEQLTSSFRRILHEINGQVEQIKREEIYRITKLKKIFDKLQKNGDLCSVLQNSGISISDQNDNLNNCLHDLQKAMRNKFDENIGDSSTIKSCFELVNACEPLKYLDGIFKCQFQKTMSDFKNQLSINVQQHGYDVNPRQFIHAGNIDTYTFKKVYEFLKDYQPNTPQGKKYISMMERLKTELEEEDRSLQPIFNRHYGGSNIIQEDEIYKIYSAVSKHLSTIAKVNEIVNENQQIQVSPDTLQKISKVGQLIMEACEKRIKLKISQGAKGYVQAENLIQKVRYLESLLCQLKIPEFQKYLQNKQAELGGNNVANYYWDQISLKKQQKDQKYFQSQTIEYTSELVTDYQTFTEQEKIQVDRKIAKQIEKDLQEIKLNSKKQNEKVIKSLFKQAFDKTQNLPSDMRWKMKQVFEDALTTSLSERQEEIEAARTKYAFKDSYDLILAEDRPHIAQLYQSMTNKQFENRKSEFFKNSDDIEKVKENLFSTFIEHFKQKDLDTETTNPKFNVIYQRYIEQATRNVRMQIDKCFKKIKQQFTTTFIQKSQESSIQIIKLLFTEVVELVKFMMINKKTFSKFDEKNDLELLEKTIEAFHVELMKKTDELSYEAIKNSPKVLNLWYFESMCYLAAVQSLNVPDIPQILAIYDRLKPGMDKIIEKKNTLSAEIASRVQKIEKIMIYSETMKNNSDKQREKYFEEINQDLSLIDSFGKSGIKLTQHDFLGLVDKTSKKIKKDIEEGIDRSCQDVENGFSNVSTQFNKQINVSLKIASAVQSLSFVNVDKFVREKLSNKIESSYNNCFENLRRESQRIEPLRNDVQMKLRNIKTVNNQRVTKTKGQKEIELNNKIIKLNQNLKLDIQNEKDQSKHAGLMTNCENQIKQLEKQHRIVMQQLQKQCASQQQKANSDYEKKTSGIVQSYGDIVTILYKATLQINYKQQQMKDKLEKVLQNDSQSYGKRVFNNIYEGLKAKNNNYATILINSHEAFKNNQALQWQAKVKGNGVDYVLSQLKISQDKKNELKDLFQRYTSQFNSWTKKYQGSPSNMTINQLLEKVRTQSSKLKDFYHGAGNASLIAPQILLALIFALWTILSSEVEDEIVQFSYQPHPAQVIAIFLCLSFIKSDDPKDLSSKMAQIGTGEGKSVVLAGLSSYLALCDFQVNSVCYSVYLSSRDRQAFANLFEKLQINTKISYGTFDNVCESLLNKQNSESKGFRNQIKSMLEEQKPGWFGKIINKIASLFKNLIPSANDSNQSKKIMLIDEVDVFFDPSFFGSLYCPDVCLASPQVSELMKFVWKSFKDKPEIDDLPIANSTQFSNVIKKYSKLQKLFKQQIKGMILGCRGCDHDYVIRDDLIQYKDQDGISSKINYGFQTLFAYLKEHDRNKITGSSLERALKVSLIIAEFSYALLPKYFRSIIGVTGTYEDMSIYKKRYMQTEYHVKAAYAIPSVYGSAKRRVIKNPRIVPPDQHHAEIIKEIKEVHVTQRPVLVFFKSATDLQNFFNLAAFQDLQPKTTFLNETHAANERDLRIKMTCNRNKITLMTNSFGRGTDFKVYDESLYQIGDGGLHVIQTFLSVDLSQQIQIQGRTARQGNPGTYTLVIPVQDMELLDMKPEAANNFSNELQKARQARENKQWSQIIARLNQSNIKHQNCINIYKNQNVEEKQIIQYIKQLNGFQQIRGSICKTIILCDATGSMSAVLQKLLSIIGEVVKDIIEITSQHSTSSTSQLQLGVYRNYNCSAEMIFQSTPFESQAHNLLSFLKTIYAAGGMGNQAIQTAYYHINSIPDVDQVIIIGDAPANTDQETAGKRSGKGQNYWNSHNIPLLSARNQLNKIVNKAIPIHSFFIPHTPHVQPYFRDVSQRTNGYAQQFNVHAADSSKKLSQFIAERILLKVAKDAGQATQMVTMYRKRHGL